jgi:phosphatidate phosphatase APP1
VVAFGLVYFGLHAGRLVPNPHPAAQTPASALTQPGAPGSVATPATSQFNTELAQADAYQSVHGSYIGWPTPPGAQIATVTDKLVLSQTVGGVCYYSQLVPGQTPKAATDATGAACTPANTALNQQALNIEAQAQARIANMKPVP